MNTSTLRIIDVIADRRSPKVFSRRAVPTGQIRSLIQAAGRAASSFNEQPWRFLVAHQGSAAFDAMGEVLMSGNAWAKDAPVLMLAMTSRHFSRNGKDNAHARHDLGLAMGNLCAQATADDLLLHQMGGFDREAARSAFNIADEFDLVTMVAIGYQADPATLSDEELAMEQKRSSRKPVQDIMHEFNAASLDHPFSS